MRLIDGSRRLWQFLAPGEHICLNDLQSKSQTIWSVWVAAKTVSHERMVRGILPKQAGLIQSMSLDVCERERDMQKRERESKMVIWSEVRNETCHSKLEPCCLNYSGPLLKEQSAHGGEESGQRALVLSKKSERQTEGEFRGIGQTREVIYSGSR